MVEVLQTALNNISTDFMQNLSTNYTMVEVVEVVEIFFLLKKGRRLKTGKKIEILIKKEATKSVGVAGMKGWCIV
jgi:hypothetical protein